MTAPSAHELFRVVVRMVRKERFLHLYGVSVVLAAVETEHGATLAASLHTNVAPGALAAAARAELDLITTASGWEGRAHRVGQSPFSRP